jgi:hypothetical protein
LRIHVLLLREAILAATTSSASFKYGGGVRSAFSQLSIVRGGIPESMAASSVRLKRCFLRNARRVTGQPADGCTLFRTLYEDRDGHGVEVTMEFPFAAADSPEVHQLRQDILAECWDDSQLSQIACYSERHHREEWLRTEVDSLLQDALLWKRAKGLVLASFTSISNEQFEEMVKLAQIRHTRVEDLRKNVRGDVLAQY